MMKSNDSRRAREEELAKQQRSDEIADELDLKIQTFTSRAGSLELPGEGLPNDPFAGIYDTDYSGSETEEAADEVLRNLVSAHDLDAWEHQIGAELADVSSRRFEAEKEYESTVWKSERAKQLKEGQITDLQKAEDVLISHALQVEDDRSGLIETVSRNLIIEPDYHPAILEQLVLQNSILGQLVEAMEVNIAGTGWELLANETFQTRDAVQSEMSTGKPVKKADPTPQLPTDDPSALGPQDATSLEPRTQASELSPEEEAYREELERQLESLEGFFKEPWPGMSFTTLRRKLRFDMEATGNAYLEIVRNSSGQIIFARHIDTKLMRIVRLDDPIVVTKEIERAGSKQSVRMTMRERRFVMQVGGGALKPRFQQAPSSNRNPGADPSATTGNLNTRALFGAQGTRIVYFREFGSSRDLDMWLGTWAKPDEEIPMERRATEIIHLGVKKSPTTPYYLPRWINNFPSVLGNRKAEEFNVSYFDGGGVPPLLLTVAGGHMGTKARQALDKHFNSRNPASKHKAIIMEITPAGRMDKQNKVDVKVERFGSERMQDAMFSRYDEQTRDKTRQSFRLPPVFVGDAEAHNFATLRASYLVAEAQVFQPERDEEDEIFSMLLLRNMPSGDRFRFRSLPLVIDDAADQVKCIELAAENSLVDGEQLIQALNQVCNLEFRYDAETHLGAKQEQAQQIKTLSQGFAGSSQRADAKEPTQSSGRSGGSESYEQIQDQGGGRVGTGAGGAQSNFKLAKIEEATKLTEMVNGLVGLGVDLADALQDGFSGVTARRAIAKNVSLYQDLLPEQKAVVDRVMALRGLGSDRDDVLELFGCAAAVITDVASREASPE